MRLLTIFTIRLFILAALATICFANDANTSEATPYQQKARVKYIENVLLAMKNTPRQELENTNQYIGVVDINNCHSDMLRLRLECMVTYANENCESLHSKTKRKRCEYYSDVAITNRLSEKVFLTKSEKYRIAKNYTRDEVKTARNQKLRQKYGRIATEFYLSQYSDCTKVDSQCLARGLDNFCLDYTNKHNLSWQYCVGASVWFIGTSSKTPTKEAN